MTEKAKDPLEHIREIRNILDAILLYNEEWSIRGLSLPLQPLLNAMSDISLIISRLLSEGTVFYGQRNPEIKFKGEFFDPADDVFNPSKDRYEHTWKSAYDPLGNLPSSRKRISDRHVGPHPELSSWFRDLAVEIIFLKREMPKPSFMEDLARLARKNSTKLSKAEYFFRKRRSQQKRK